jgi:hypothetical protein
MSASPLRLDARALFWRVALAVFVMYEWWLWSLIRRIPFHRGRPRLWMFLLSPRALGRSALVAMIVAGAATIVAEILVWLIVRPLVTRWHAPRVDGSEIEFQLEPGESLYGSVAARRKAGFVWTPGALVLTNKRLAFFPAQWNSPPWSAPRTSVVDARIDPAPSVFWGLVLGWPDRFAVDLAGEAPELFAAADPGGLCAWFSPLDPAPPHPAVGSTPR